MRDARGFTLIELLVTIALLAVIMGVAVPSFREASVAGKVSDNANRLASSAALARGEAIKRNSRVSICMSSNGSSCASSGGWEQGWIIFTDPNGNGVKDSGDTVLQQEGAAPAGYHITESSSKTALVFQPTSIGTTIATWVVCRYAPEVSAQQRQVDVGATGRSSVRKITASTCA